MGRATLSNGSRRRFVAVATLLVSMGCATDDPAFTSTNRDGDGAGAGFHDAGGSGGSRDAGRGGVSTDTGPSGGGTGSGGTSVEGDSSFSCPPYPELPYANYPWSPDPSLFDAATFGCYVGGGALAPEGFRITPRPAPCLTERCTYEPRALPCGSCTDEGSACTMGVYAACDCGHGPFIDSYSDDWLCKCTNGQWDCRIVDRSGASCEVCWSTPDAGSR